MDIRPLLQITTVLLAAGAAAYFGVARWGSHEQATASAGSSRADYLVDGIELWQSDERGQLLRHVVGSRLAHEPSPERYQLKSPVITLFRNGHPQWHLSGQVATSPDPGRDIWLERQVVATRDPAAGDSLRLDTERLHADPAANRIQAPGPVRTTSRHGHWNGSALDADLNAQTLNFSAPVEVEYAPSY